MTGYPPTRPPGTSPRAAVALVALLFVPWTVVITAGGTGLVFAWGLVNPVALHVTSLPAYLFVHTAGLPDYLLAWPIGVVIYVGGLLSALGGTLFGREDRRLTGGLLVLAGVSELGFAIGIGRPSGVVAIPVGTVLLWLVAWWWYGPALSRAVWPR